MLSETPPQEIQTTPSRVAATKAALRLFGKAALLALAAIVTMVVLVWTVPDENDYAEASILKHDRLESLTSPKIVLVGGSNLAFGVDSRAIEEATGCPVVNMGMNGYFGIRYMLSEVKPNLKAGDVVVLAFEYDNFFKPVDGSSLDLFGVTKANPRVFRYMTPAQQFRVVAEVPFVAQQKILRVIRQSIEGARNAALGPRPGPAAVDVDKIETFAGFTPEGDLVSHLGVHWPYNLETGIVTSARPIETRALDLMQQFTKDVTADGVNVLVSYTSARRRYYRDHISVFEELHRQINARPPMIAPSPPSRFTFERVDMFDTVYHLDREGRAIRTQLLIEDLQREFGARVQCDAGRMAQH